MAGLPFATRRAGPTDADAIAATHRDSIQTIGARFYSEAIVRDWTARLAGSLYAAAMEQGETFFVATGAGGDISGVLGFASHRIEEGEHRTAVYVRGAAARRGVGSALFRLAEAEAIAANATHIHVAASLAAVEFYRSHGFDDLGSGEHHLWSGRAMACVFMRKTVRPI